MKFGYCWYDKEKGTVGKITDVDKRGKRVKVEWEVRPDDICRCECHKEGANMLHIMPCCDLSHHSYIINGMVDFIKYFSASKFDIVKRKNK